MFLAIAIIIIHDYFIYFLFLIYKILLTFILCVKNLKIILSSKNKNIIKIKIFSLIKS